MMHHLSFISAHDLAEDLARRTVPREAHSYVALFDPLRISVVAELQWSQFL